MEIFQDTFIYRTADEETETGIKALGHIGIILMAQQLQKHGGHQRLTGLMIGLVAKLAPVPSGIKGVAYIVDYLIGDSRGELLGCLATASVP